MLRTRFVAGHQKSPRSRVATALMRLLTRVASRVNQQGKRVSPPGSSIARDDGDERREYPPVGAAEVRAERKGPLALLARSVED